MPRIYLLLVLFFPVVIRGQAASPTNVAPVISVSAMSFALSVADVEASARWYVEKLGLTITTQLPRTDATGARVTILQGGGLMVELVQQDDAVPLRSVLAAKDGALSVHGIFKVGVMVDDFDTTVATLRARGIEIAYGPYPKRPDQQANVIIRDNAGNLIQITGR